MPRHAAPTRGRRWLAWIGLATLVAVTIGAAVAQREPGQADVAAAGPSAPSSSTSTTTTTTQPPRPTVPASQRRLVLLDTIHGDIRPKSVVVTPQGLFLAQNMMYRHTITVYDREHRLLKTIPDAIDAAAFGLDFAPGTTLRGAPVEAAVTPDGRYAYVSNYVMYGPGFSDDPGDACNNTGHDPSYVYRLDLDGLEIDDVIEVGAVPKFLAVSPDGAHLLVSNWCSFDVSIIEIATGAEVVRHEVGRHPRGIVFSPDGEVAYVTVMDGDKVAVIDMATLAPSRSFPLSGDPRHILVSPDGAHLYVTRNVAGDVVKLDAATGQVVASVATGAAPRSMAISPDGEALYVVNNDADTVSKVLTADFTEVQELPTGNSPIGVTYDPETDRVWVANYTGSLMVFEDRPEEPAA